MTLSELIEADDRPPAQHPAFWNAYRAPASHVAAEVQRPSHMVNGDTLAVAYMRDWRSSRRLSAQESDDGR